MRNGLVEDFRTALDMLTQAAPTSNVSSIEPGTNIWICCYGYYSWWLESFQMLWYNHDFTLPRSFFFVLRQSFNKYHRLQLFHNFRFFLSFVSSEGRNDRADTVIVVDEDNASSTSSGSGTRHRLTPNVSGNQFGRSTSS